MVIAISKMVRTSDAAPSQWDGWDNHGNHFYFRYRYGLLRVTYNEGEDGEENIVMKRVGDMMDGYMSYEDLKNHVKPAIALPDLEQDSEPYESVE